MTDKLTNEEITFLKEHAIDVLSCVESNQIDELLLDVNDLIVDYLDNDYNSTEISVYVQSIYGKILENY